MRTSEKYRMVYSDFQRLELEKEFRTSQFINSDRKSQLSSELQLTERQIKIWFQNRYSLYCHSFHQIFTFFFIFFIYTSLRSKRY